MGQRPDRHQHAAKRRRNEQGLPALSRQQLDEEKVPLAGYEALYEITRSGRVYSLKTHSFQANAYPASKFIRITANGAIVSLDKQKAVADSWRKR
jgi:hypothetical protein